MDTCTLPVSLFISVLAFSEVAFSSSNCWTESSDFLVFFPFGLVVSERMMICLV